MLPALLFRGDRKLGALPVAMLAAFVAAGVYINLTMQTRTPFLAVAAACAVGLVMLFATDASRLVTKIRQAMLVPLVGVAVAAVVALVPGLGVMERFEVYGLETARYEQWEAVLLGLAHHFDGGRAIPLTERFAHNLWLDVAWDAGGVPFLLLLAFHVASIPPVVSACRSGAELGPRLVLAGIGIAFAFTAMSEPVNAFAINYYAFSFYYFGSALGLAQRWREKDLAREEEAEGLLDPLPGASVHHAPADG
jgi:hypothetical protein